MKDNPDYKEKVKLRKHDYYIDNKDVLRENEKFRYHNNMEYHDKKELELENYINKKQLTLLN